MSENCIGTDVGLFEIKKFGEEYFTFITECKDTKACSIVLRGASKDVLMEVERNLQDAMQVRVQRLLTFFLSKLNLGCQKYHDGK